MPNILKLRKYCCTLIYCSPLDHSVRSSYRTFEWTPLSPAWIVFWVKYLKVKCPSVGISLSRINLVVCTKSSIRPSWPWRRLRNAVWQWKSSMKKLLPFLLYHLLFGVALSSYSLGENCFAHYCECPPFLSRDPSLKRSLYFNKYPYPEHYAILGRAKELHCCIGGNFSRYFKIEIFFGRWRKLEECSCNVNILGCIYCVSNTWVVCKSTYFLKKKYDMLFEEFRTYLISFKGINGV